MNEYEKQVSDFLAKTETTISIIEAQPQKSPLWIKNTQEKHGINYTVTLQNKRHKYVFDFWNSIASREKIEAIKQFNSVYSIDYSLKDKLEKMGIKYFDLRLKEKREKLLNSLLPTKYDVMACLNPLQEDSFKEFCGSFGYDEDSIIAEKTYKACIEQDRNLRKLFTLDELDMLSEIN